MLQEMAHDSGTRAARMLTVEGVSKTFLSGGQPLVVLHEVTFDVTSGSTVAIVGPSGSGKSTLLAILAGLERPTAGRVVLDGAELGALGEDDLSRLRRDR